MTVETSKLFYLVKLVRIILGFRLLNVQTYMIQIKRIINLRIQKLVETNSALANSQLRDNTNITFIIYAHSFLKAF